MVRFVENMRSWESKFSVDESISLEANTRAWVRLPVGQITETFLILSGVGTAFLLPGMAFDRTGFVSQTYHHRDATCQRCHMPEPVTCYQGLHSVLRTFTFALCHVSLVLPRNACVRSKCKGS